MPLTLDDLKAASRTAMPMETVVVPCLGEVCLRGMTALERDNWETGIAAAREAKHTVNVRGSLVARALCNESGAPLIANPDGPDGLAIGMLPAKYVSQMFDVAARLSGVTKDDAEELAKNAMDAGASSTA